MSGHVGDWVIRVISHGATSSPAWNVKRVKCEVLRGNRLWEVAEPYVVACGGKFSRVGFYGQWEAAREE